MSHDVVIVGGGIAGLSAAWWLRHRDVLLLEAGDRVGGRTRSDPCGDYWLNYGAHLFPASGSLVDSMARDCGLETVPVTGAMMGLAVGSTLLTTGRVESYPLRLPLPLREKLAFAWAGLKVQRAVARYHRAGRRLGFEDDRTFAELLGPLPPAVREIFSCAAHRATAELDELSAGCGIGLFALVWGGKESLIARNLLGGTGRLAGRAGPRARRTRADELPPGRDPPGRRPARSPVRRRPGERTPRDRRRAGPHAAPLVAGVTERGAAALEQLTYGAFLCVAVETNESTAMPYDSVYAMATPGRAFDMFTNQAHALRSEGPRRPGGSLMLFAGARHAEALLREGDETIVARFLADLHKLYPQTRGIIAGATVHRWPLGNVYARPGRSRLQAALDRSLGAHANLHLAGDYFAELGNLEAAARSGLAAADRVDAGLREVTHA